MAEENFVPLIVDSGEIPILIDMNLVRWSISSYLRGYHAYMNIWNPLVGDDALFCRKENANVHDAHAVAIIVGNNIVGHVPENICGFFWRFLSLPQTTIRAEVVGPRVNRGAGHGLEIPVRYIFQGHGKAVDWIRRKVEEEEARVEARFKKCLKNAV